MEYIFLYEKIYVGMFLESTDNFITFTLLKFPYIIGLTGEGLAPCIEHIWEIYTMFHYEVG